MPRGECHTAIRVRVLGSVFQKGLEGIPSVASQSPLLPFRLGRLLLLLSLLWRLARLLLESRFLVRIGIADPAPFLFRTAAVSRG